jgi:hypothetical protein
MKTKNIKTILPSYSAIASSDQYQLRIMKEKKFSNEAGFLEIAILEATLQR